MFSPDQLHSLVAVVERLRSQEGGECSKCGRACVHCGKGQDADIAKLKAEKQELEQEKIGMLSMIDKLRCQIAKLKEVSRAAGYGDIMDKMMEESMLSETMRSEEMSCFFRLYLDAVSRMDKWESFFTQQKLVATNLSPHELAQQFPEVLQHVSQRQQLEPLQHSPAASTTSLGFVVGLEGGRQGGEPADGGHAGRHDRLPALLQPFRSTKGFSPHTSKSSFGSTGGRLPRPSAANSKERGGAPLAGGSASPPGRGIRNTNWPASEEAGPRIEKGASAPLLGRALVHSGKGYRSRIFLEPPKGESPRNLASHGASRLQRVHIAIDA